MGTGSDARRSAAMTEPAAFGLTDVPDPASDESAAAARALLAVRPEVLAARAEVRAGGYAPLCVSPWPARRARTLVSCSSKPPLVDRASSMN